LPTFRQIDKIVIQKTVQSLAFFLRNESLLILFQQSLNVNTLRLLSFYLEISKSSLNFALEIKPFMPNVLHLDDLRNGCSGILPSLGSFMCDCAIYMFASQGHLSGMTLQVQTDNGNTDYVITWDGGLSLQMLRSMNDEERAIDYGAMCIAIFLVRHLTEYQHFIFSKKGTGVDFILFQEDPKDTNQKADARLEISGIRQESRTNTIVIRHKLKKKQVQQSDAMNVNVYIVITEFSKPKSLFAVK
jgi:hypothetical protein